MAPKTSGVFFILDPSLCHWSKDINIGTRIYYDYLNTRAMYIVRLNRDIVKNNPVHERKFCNIRLTVHKYVKFTENKNIFNFETLFLYILLNNKAFPYIKYAFRIIVWRLKVYLFN